MVETYLDQLFTPIAFMHFPFESVSRMPSLRYCLITKCMLSIQASNPSSGSVSEEFIINFSDIEQLASLALDMCSDTYHVLLIPFGIVFSLNC